MLTSFMGGRIFSNLQLLDLSLNQFTGHLHLKANDFPSFLGTTTLDLSHNSGLTKVDADENAVLTLRTLFLINIEGIEVGPELCDRSSLDIYPSVFCS